MTTKTAHRAQQTSGTRRNNNRGGRNASYSKRTAKPEDKTGKLEVCRAEHGARYHTASCAILRAEVTLPSRHDLTVAMSDMTSENYVARQRGVVREWRTPTMLDPMRICACLGTVLAEPIL